jgi:predicted transcriptional regulator
VKTTPWKDIKATASPGVRAGAAQRTAEMLAAIPLAELRRARELSQVTLAELLEASQSEVSKIEHRTDLYVSTLRRYVEAMGGELDIVARFPDGSVRINQFEEIEAA